MLNNIVKHPVIQPNTHIISIMMEDWIADLPWPHFIECVHHD